MVTGNHWVFQERVLQQDLWPQAEREDQRNKYSNFFFFPVSFCSSHCPFQPKAERQWSLVYTIHGGQPPETEPNTAGERSSKGRLKIFSKDSTSSVPMHWISNPIIEITSSERTKWDHIHPRIHLSPSDTSHKPKRFCFYSMWLSNHCAIYLKPM